MVGKCDTRSENLTVRVNSLIISYHWILFW